jgi:hypothetical protein
MTLLPAPLNVVFSVSATDILGLKLLVTRWAKINLVFFAEQLVAHDKE